MDNFNYAKYRNIYTKVTQQHYVATRHYTNQTQEAYTYAYGLDSMCKRTSTSYSHLYI